MNSPLQEAIHIMREMLKHGEHAGPCVIEDEFHGGCDLHVAAGAARDKMARDYLEKYADEGPSTKDLRIWWLEEQDMVAIGDELPLDCPEYLRVQFRSLLGRAGRGRLWIDEQFGEVGISPWPETAIGRRVYKSGGIVLKMEDCVFVAQLPGLVTDFKLRRPKEKS